MTEKVNTKKFFAIAIAICVTSWRKIDKPRIRPQTRRLPTVAALLAPA